MLRKNNQRSGSVFPGEINQMQNTTPGQKPKALLALTADIQGNPSSAVKYRYLIREFNKKFRISRIINTQPSGLLKVILGIYTFKLSKDSWREGLNKNLLGFRLSSYLVNQQVKNMVKEIDFSLQIGCLFDSTWPNKRKPNFIYTDYTSALSAKKPESGRSPFSSKELERWMLLEKQAYWSADHLFVRSRIVKASLMGEYDIPEEKISVVGGGWNFSSAPPKIERTFTNTINILFIGKRFYRKGGDLLIEAYNKLKREFPNATLTIVTKSHIPAEYYDESIRVLAPIWDRTKIHQLFLDAHLFVLPSRLETWGDVLLEAMAYGLPIIGVDTDAMPEIILEGKTGHLARVGDSESLYYCLVDLVKDPKKMKIYGDEARKVAHSQYTWEKVVQQIAAIIALYQAPSGENNL